jgi:hypothetical protein
MQIRPLFPPRLSPAATGSPARRQGRWAVRWAALRVALVFAVLLVAEATMVPAEAAPHRRSTVTTRIDQFLRAQMKDSAIPGAAVAVTRGDRVLMVRGYGHDSTGEAVTGDSLIRIASLSKSFTALAVMQLVDAGLLHLDDPVQELLPESRIPVRRGAVVRRRRGEPLRAALGLVPAVMVLGAGVAYPRVAEAWIGRDVTWRAAAYGWPALVVFVLAALVAGAATLLALAWQWWRIGGANPHPNPSNHVRVHARQQ